VEDAITVRNVSAATGESGNTGATIVDHTSASNTKFITKPTLTITCASRRPYSSATQSDAKKVIAYASAAPGRMSAFPTTGSENGSPNMIIFDAVTCEVTSAVTNSATRPTCSGDSVGGRATDPVAVPSLILRHLLVLQPAVPVVYLVEDVQVLANRRADGVAPVDELPVVADVAVQVTPGVPGESPRLSWACTLQGLPG